MLDPQGEQPETEESFVVRMKAARACDLCRRKRRRCEPLPKKNVCKQCLQGKQECTWVLPISETRHKRRGHVQNSPPGDDSDSPQSSKRPRHPLLRQDSPVILGGSLFSMVSSISSPKPSFGYALSETKLRGPTTITHMMHSTSTFPTELLEAHDKKHRTYAEMQQHAGDAIIRVASLDLNNGSLPSSPSLREIDSVSKLPTPTYMEPALIERLIRFYFDVHAPSFPVVSKDAFISSTPLSPVLVYAMVGISAMTVSSRAPKGTLEAVQTNMSALRRTEDFLSRSTLHEIQGHLLFALTMEMEQGSVGTAVWNSLGMAIRQAQELGLHRETTSNDPDDHVEARRNVWGGLIVADRWISAFYGLPMMIDLGDCDRIFPKDDGFKSLIELSILLGRVVKMCYTPTGVINVKDEQAQALANEIQSWLFALPPTLSCINHSPEHAPISAGLLNLCYVAVQFFFVRPFMRLSHTADSLSFSITVADWQALVARARYGILWSEHHLDQLQAWSFSLYCLFICCLILYHTYYRSRRPDELTAILKGKAIMDRISHPDCHARSKIAEVISLLSDAATNPREDTAMKRTSINPTRGVRLRQREPNLRWRADTNSFAGDPGVESDEKPVPSHLVASPAADTPSTPIYSGNPLPYPIPVNVNPLMHGLVAATNLYEPELTFLDIATDSSQHSQWSTESDS
ncbi:fungal-specific transcription factor domain-containing protein [Armillaria novae-zelandiae]|uniref:Fungal-specific transcription factor domain-containing protein n=1 Tax=Armillaria novae-zelandiae TaxID=153914 RepID=A0AA39NXR3_9AGAR|nr:fungal-specific transcription factor domain-containing protein [Armillaria novae-zelandiae]